MTKYKRLVDMTLDERLERKRQQNIAYRERRRNGEVKVREATHGFGHEDTKMKARLANIAQKVTNWHARGCEGPRPSLLHER